MDIAYAGFIRLLLCCATLVAGCATPRAQPATVNEPITVPWNPPSYTEPTAETLLRYIDHIRRAPIAVLEHEARETEQRAIADPSGLNQMRQALFLAFAPAPFRATARAHAVLDGMSREGGELQSLAQLLAAALQERLNLEAALADERRQRQGLRHKLDQLKAIEEDLGRDRQSPVINPR